MDTVLFFFHIISLLVFNFRVEEKFAGGKFREIPCALDIYFAGGKFRAKSKFANIAKISSTRKIRVIHSAGSRLRGARGIYYPRGPFAADSQHLPLQRVQEEKQWGKKTN